MSLVEQARKIKQAKAKAGLHTPAQQERMKRNRLTRATVVTGIEAVGKRTTITPGMFDKIDVDRRYQRDRIGPKVNELIEVIQSGGVIPDPITLCKRRWSEDGQVRASDKLWLIDGQQRFFAAMETETTIEALIYESDSLEAERNFFLAMNNSRIVNANVTVKAWPGPITILLKAVESNPDHPLYGRVEWSRTGGEHIGAAVLVRGLVAVTTGVFYGGDIQKMLSRADTAIQKDSAAKARATQFCRLIAHVFPRGYAPILAVSALGIVASRRWAQVKYNDPALLPLPTTAQMDRMSRINWLAEVPSSAIRFRPVLEQMIDRAWRTHRVGNGQEG